MAGKRTVEVKDERSITGLRRWRVRRRILPWNRHFRAEADFTNIFDVEEIFEWALACVVWVLEGLVALVVGPVLIVYRVLLHRPWRVEAATDDTPERLTWFVKGRGRAGRKVVEVADRLARGERFEDEADERWEAPVRATSGHAPSLGGYG